MDEFQEVDDVSLRDAYAHLIQLIDAAPSQIGPFLKEEYRLFMEVTLNGLECS